MKKLILNFTLLFVTISVMAQFDGAVGTAGCRAIFQDDPGIKGWATGCDVFRGYQDIATSELLASYGEAEHAVGIPDNTGLLVVSLGDSGVAILSFDIPISNGEGYDFAIFENSFSHTFLELGFVEVSSDGSAWVRFPATSLTPTNEQIGGFGHIDPTHINNLAGKYKFGWGTPFDLEELRDSSGIDINNINFVKIIDVIGTIDPQFAQYDAFGNIVNDPYPTDFASGGFDLGGVAVLNGWLPASIKENDAPLITVYPNPCTDFIKINNLNQRKNVALYTVLGSKLLEMDTISDEITIETKNLPSGMYLLKIEDFTCKIIKR